MALTYEPIATTTLASNQATVVFSSISSAYTDLIIVAKLKTVTVGSFAGRFNSDSGTNYTRITMGADGSTTQSTGGSGTNLGIFSTYGGSTTGNFDAISTVYIHDYASTFNYKQALCRASNSNNGISAVACGWTNSAAINSITFLNDGGASFAIGCVFTLYGVKAA
jgi:hypothetical protein